jgi:sugar phosphate isomerase/epimerase
LKFAICNETFQGWEWERTCHFVADTGYDGIEIAPFTFAEDARSLGDEDRRRIRSVAEDAGLPVTALHWLLVSPEGLHVNSPNPATRERTADYLAALVELAGDLGAGAMVFGSPKQRRIAGGISRDQAERWAEEAVRSLIPALERREVRLAMEPLPPPEADLWLTAAETLAFVDRIGHPLVGLHLDVKSMCAEGDPAEVIREYGARAFYFHANDANRRGPGFGDVDFSRVLRALGEAGYDGWASVEVFDYSPDPETIARKSLETLRSSLPGGFSG